MSSPARTPAQRPGSATIACAVRTGSVCGALALALLVMVATGWAPLTDLDRAVAEGLHRRAVVRPGEVRVARVLTDWVWDPWTARALITVAVVALWWRGARLLAGWIAATMLFSTLLQQGIKAAVGRDRPRWQDPVDSAQYAAFPSGHAMSATVGCGLLLWLLWRARTGTALRSAAVVVACVSVAGVCFTRVYLGVHWLSDVVAGVLFGTSVVAFSVAGHTAYCSRAGRGGRAAGNLSHRS
ncbi:phosphatase PAP2 family protein [Streptomyces sp. NBC_00102]|uniref:phosphatase PAP2 family protein n=1 Tax=Streptomyces sp. NBC_00102 TaxID=2975652 RepID=UPI002259EE02|nr:phosphatase PAP2 family protein [Streptomyces sp. NBC_00102]MCX5401602.1 phosphatase PAP2 family protein [Streptomyces sp. NBC_00102]